MKAALALCRRLLQESSWPPPKPEGVVGDVVRKLHLAFPLDSGPEDYVWKNTPHICGDGYVILEVLRGRLPEVMNVAIPIAQEVGMSAFVPSTNELYSPTDVYTPQPLLPSGSELDAMVGELTGTVELAEAVESAIQQGLEEMGFSRVNPRAYARKAKSCTHLVGATVEQRHLDGSAVLHVSVGIRFESAERIRAAADRPEMRWDSHKTHPTVGFSLGQLAPDLPRQWQIRSREEGIRTGTRVVESLRDHAEPYFRKYSDPDVVLDALVENGEEARWLGYDSLANSSYKRALTTLALCASRGEGQQLGDVIAMMRGLVEKEGPAAVRGFDRFVDKLRSLKDPG